MLTIKGSTDGTEFRHVFARAALMLAYIAEINSHTKSTELTEGTRYARAYHPGGVGQKNIRTDLSSLTRINFVESRAEAEFPRESHEKTAVVTTTVSYP